MSGLRTISMVGAKPRITAPQSGSASAIWIAKQTAITPSSVTIEGLDPAEAEALHPQDQEHVERGDDHADLERNAEQQIEPDRRADHLGEVGRADRDLGQQPQRPRHRARERVAAGLRQIAAGADAQPRTQAPAAGSPSGWRAARRSAARSRTSSRRRARSPSCRDPYSRPRPDSRGRGTPAASARSSRWAGCGCCRTPRRAREWCADAANHLPRLQGGRLDRWAVWSGGNAVIGRSKRDA